MTLGFSTHIKGQPTFFVEKIWRGFYTYFFETIAQQHLEYSDKRKEALGELILVQAIGRGKIHSIREDKHNRWKPGMKIHMVTGNRTSKRFQFAPILNVVTTQKVEIRNIFNDRNAVRIDGRELSETEIEQLAINDGFDTVDDFWNWFSMEDFEGKIIHWTNHTY
jgi:hypothetical protein